MEYRDSIASTSPEKTLSFMIQFLSSGSSAYLIRELMILP